MTIGWIGLGKLGLPCALAMEEQTGQRIVGYDKNPDIKRILREEISYPFSERDIEGYLAENRNLLESKSGHGLELVDSIADVVKQTSRHIFVSVQTPHQEEYGGENIMPQMAQDFNYSYVKNVVREISKEAKEQSKEVIVFVISTMLPETMRYVVAPLVDSRYVSLVYNPFFIAMGTTIEDFIYPEFVLLGTDSISVDMLARDFYDLIYGSSVPIVSVSWEEAELIKVAYNTFISLKIVFANTLGEICTRLEGKVNVDHVTDTLRLAKRRVISDSYLSAGMGDGGACHPRDNIAMSYLAEKLNLSYDLFSVVTKAREDHSWAMADYIREISNENNLSVVLLGKIYKPNSNLTNGSPALLLANQLDYFKVKYRHWCPKLDDDSKKPDHPAVYFLAANLPELYGFEFPQGSIVIDPFRIIDPFRTGKFDERKVKVISLGISGS